MFYLPTVTINEGERTAGNYAAPYIKPLLEQAPVVTSSRLTETKVNVAAAEGYF